MFKMIDHGPVSALRRERPDVQFVDHPIVDVGPTPSAIGPTKSRRIDDLGRTMYALRLKSRGRIRQQATVEAGFLEHAGPNFRDFYVIVKLSVPAHLKLLRWNA